MKLVQTRPISILFLVLGLIPLLATITANCAGAGQPSESNQNESRNVATSSNATLIGDFNRLKALMGEDFSRLEPSIEMDDDEGRHWALASISSMGPFGLESPPPASSGLRHNNEFLFSDAGEGHFEAGAVGSVQGCYDFCSAEVTVTGWIWAGGGYKTQSGSWWGSHGFAEKELYKGKPVSQYTLPCGKCASSCQTTEDEWKFFIGRSGFGPEFKVKAVGVEVGGLLSINTETLCDGSLELIVLFDLKTLLPPPLGPAVNKGIDFAKELAKRKNVELDCSVGIAISGTAHMCKSVPGGGLHGITSDSATICGGGFIGCGFGLSRNKANLHGAN